MSTTSTPNLNLVKPTLGTGEHADVSVINGNMDKIDAAVGELADSIRTPSSAFSNIELPNGTVTVLSNTAVTAPISGDYILIVKGTFSSSNNGNRIVGFSLNSTTQQSEWLHYQTAVQNDYTKMSSATMLHLNANDVIRAALYQNSGSSLSADATVFLILVHAD